MRAHKWSVSRPAFNWGICPNTLPPPAGSSSPRRNTGVLSPPSQYCTTYTPWHAPRFAHWHTPIGLLLWACHHWHALIIGMQLQLLLASSAFSLYLSPLLLSSYFQANLSHFNPHLSTSSSVFSSSPIHHQPRASPPHMLGEHKESPQLACPSLFTICRKPIPYHTIKSMLTLSFPTIPYHTYHLSLPCDVPLHY